jgi:hypothetical protein
VPFKQIESRFIVGDTPLPPRDECDSKAEEQRNG